MLIDRTELFSRQSPLHRQHQELEMLCVLLEQIADDLPRPQAPDCKAAVALLDRFITSRNDLASMFGNEITPQSRVVALAHIIERMTAQWKEEEGLAQEIIDELAHIDPSGTTHSMNYLGYMLRAFFTSCRRSMLAEELAVRLSYA